jgi:transcription antitermination protein NusB
MGKRQPGGNRERGERLALERRAARLAAVQALYQWEATGAKPDAIVAEFTEHRIGQPIDGIDLPPADGKLFSLLVNGVAAQAEELDDMIAGVLTEDWTVERLEAILRAILRCGAFELAHRGDIPPKVVISEYVAVTDAFFGDKETGLTNGVLDRMARTLHGEAFAKKDGPGRKGRDDGPPAG